MGKSDADFYDELFVAYNQKMRKYAAHVLHNPETAQDLVNEAFLVLWSNIAIMRNHPNPSGWLYITLNNLIKNEVRLAKYRFEVPFTDSPDAVFGDSVSLPEQFTETPFAELTTEERSLLAWHYEERLPYEEIAAKLGLSVNNCRVKMYRAREKLRKIYKKNS